MFLNILTPVLCKVFPKILKQSPKLSILSDILTSYQSFQRSRNENLKTFSGKLFLTAGNYKKSVVLVKRGGGRGVRTDLVEVRGTGQEIDNQ